jgi:hypothetical protein
MIYQLTESDEEILREFPAWIKSTSQKGKVILLIDGIDKMDQVKINNPKFLIFGRTNWRF